jgi:hypothetical protein
MFCPLLSMGTLEAAAALEARTTLVEAALPDWLVLAGKVLLFLDRRGRTAVSPPVTRKTVEMAVSAAQALLQVLLVQQGVKLL